MADKIFMDTELMEQLSSQITQLQRYLASVNEKVISSISEVRRVASGQTGTINKLNNVQRNVMRTAERAENLARATQKAANLWAEAERRVVNQELPETQGNGNGNGEGGNGSIGQFSRDQIVDALRITMGYPEDRDSWSEDMIKKFEKALSDSMIGMTSDGRAVIISDGSLIFIGTTGVIEMISYSSGATEAKHTTTTFNPDGSYSKKEIKGGFDVMGWKGKLLVQDKEHPGQYKSLQHKPEPHWLKHDDIQTSRYGEILTAGIESSREGSWKHGELKGESGVFSGEISGNIAHGECHAEFKGGLYATKIDKNGNVTYYLEPGVSAKAGASFSLLDGHASGQIGGDNLNIHGSADVAIGKVSAEGELQLGMVNGELHANASVSAEAILIEGSAETGVNIGGIEGNIKGSVNVGVGAHAEFGLEDGKIKCDIGASLGVGASVSFELDVGGFVDNVVDTGGKVVGAIQDAGKAVFDWLF